MMSAFKVEKGGTSFRPSEKQNTHTQMKQLECSGQ